MATTKPINGIIDRNLIAVGFTNCLKKDANLQSLHPSAENLITLGHKHHDRTTCHMNLWQKVSVSGKTDLT